MGGPLSALCFVSVLFKIIQPLPFYFILDVISLCLNGIGYVENLNHFEDFSGFFIYVGVPRVPSVCFFPPELLFLNMKV